MAGEVCMLVYYFLSFDTLYEDDTFLFTTHKCILFAFTLRRMQPVGSLLEIKYTVKLEHRDQYEYKFPHKGYLVQS